MGYFKCRTIGVAGEKSGIISYAKERMTWISGFLGEIFIIPVSVAGNFGVVCKIIYSSHAVCFDDAAVFGKKPLMIAKMIWIYFIVIADEWKRWRAKGVPD